MLFNTTERNVNMGLPISYLKRPKKINKLWGEEFIALRCSVDKRITDDSISKFPLQDKFVNSITPEV